mmetsp:Transcript_28455/g.53326  ORF Transcript_28455/g.53326 Transcript_28455/m.53326 type:complete len:208 (+) Transcript_28455:100-723(+)|eukprot:CAMPEP_0170168192 /NCGR_PEP_ID=MMETSP0040_2-20121228/1330_1 /TAXON_ID=641309 /ORGANISM="Lotharella oceanica, Strain CCMP622" /LENGTH=207 /DNA_ID=CAMNT_0010406393 /DNA_START=88 /DNA_END=711 /DNA_ORIENTATION=-
MASASGKEGRESASRYAPRPSPLALLSQRECIRSRWIDAKASTTTTSSEGGTDTASVVSFDDASSRCSSGSKRKGMSVEVSSMSKRTRYSKSAGNSPRVSRGDSSFAFSRAGERKSQGDDGSRRIRRSSFSDSPRLLPKCSTFTDGFSRQSRSLKSSLPTILSNGSLIEHGSQGEEETAGQETAQKATFEVNLIGIESPDPACVDPR